MQQCIKILFHIYMKLNMFRATYRPLSGGQNCTSWTLSGRVLYLTAFNNYTSNNPPRMQNQRLLVQF